MKNIRRTIMRIMRLYGLAADDEPMAHIERLDVDQHGSYVTANFVFKKEKFTLIFGSVVSDENIEELWSNKPAVAKILPNPLDPESLATFAFGKYAVLAKIPPIGERLDTFLATKFNPSISRSLWQKYIKMGAVSVNSKIIKSPKHEILDTDEISVNFPEFKDENSAPEIIYEDSDILAINKPSGMLTHAKGGVPDEKSVADYFKNQTKFSTGTNRPGVIHRLDRDTSGILILAKNEKAAKSLQEQFATRKVKKTYLAIVSGAPKAKEAIVDLPIARNPSKPSTFRVDPAGKQAITRYKVLSSKNNFSLVKLIPETGRTHQLRVHMAHLGTPILGDRVYGKSDARLMLHAWKIGFKNIDGEFVEFTAPVPEELKKEFPDLSDE